MNGNRKQQCKLIGKKYNNSNKKRGFQRNRDITQNNPLE